MNNSYNGHKVIVFALEHYNPLGHIRSLGENGINPIYISVKRRGPVACLSKYISTCHHVDTVDEGYKLLLDLYGNEDKKPLVFRFCHNHITALHRQDDGHRSGQH